jgi:hypothetical protein
MVFPALLPSIHYATKFLLTAAILAISTHGAFAETKPKVMRQATCPLAKSVYRAIANTAFEVVFMPSKSGMASDIAALALKHKNRGSLGTYTLSGSSGYGTLHLGEIGKKTDSNSEEKLGPYFFDSKWQNVNGVLNPAPQYFFVAGLGLQDWYSEHKDNRTYPLGDLMWKFDRCQP